MKTTYTYFVVFLFLLYFPLTLVGQTWTDNLPQKSDEYTLNDYQKAFNNYWEPFEVKNGYYLDANGYKQKAPGWKQFKRLEWYWESRVDPQTGEFPEANRIDIYHAEKKNFPIPSTRDSDGSWTSLGPNSSPGGYAGLGRINTIGFSPGNANTYYAGSPSGGLWKTTDDGAIWNVLTDDNDALGLSDMIVINASQAGSDTIYIGTGDRDGGSMATLNGGQIADNNGIGILKSYDGGNTWSTTGLTFSASEGNRISRMLLDPNDDSVMLVSVIGKFSNVGEVYQSTDRGASFQAVGNERLIDMEFRPGSSDTVYGSTMNGEIHRSIDGGQTWNLINIDFGDHRIELAVTPDDPLRVYAIAVGPNRGLWAIWRSNDAGGSWAKYFDGTLANQNLLGYPCDASDDKGQGEYDLCITVDPTDADKVHIGGVNLWRSLDGGLSWDITGHWSSNCSGGATEVHADQHFLGYQPGTNHLFNGNDGGVYKTTDNAISWIWKGDGMAISQIYRIGLSASASGTYISGLQDNGSKDATGGTWTDAVGGDGMECIVDYTTNSTQYASGPNGDIYRTTNTWGSNTKVSDNIVGNTGGYWVTPYVMHPTDNNTIFAGYTDLWKSSNQGNGWARIVRPKNPSAGKLQSIAISRSDPDVMYIADNDSLFHTDNGGAGWTLRNAGLPVASSSITYISVHNSMPDTAWVSFGQYNNHGVYQTMDAGATWSNISSGLPQVPVMSVIQYKYDTANIHLYAATDIGVYVKIGDANWSRFSDGLPNVVCTELEIYYDTVGGAIPKLRAASFGRGLWESDVFTGGESPVPEFEADLIYPNTNQDVIFTDMSEKVPTSWTWKFNPSAGVTFVNGTDENSVNPQVQFATEGAYDVKLVAENSTGKDSLTKSEYINVSNLPTGYCTAGSSNGYGSINELQFGSIDNNSGFSAGGYGDFTAQTTTNEKGSNTNLIVRSSYKDVDLEVTGWIDWNRDGDFDDLQEEVACGNLNANGEFTTSVTLPVWAVSGKTKLRVRIKYIGADCATPCGISQNGEVEDYSVVVVPGAPTTAPTAEFMADNTTPPLNGNVHFLDLSTEFPDSWVWSITPSTFQFVNGTNAFSSLPQVAFNAVGDYSIELTVSNALGNDSETKTNYITVSQPVYCVGGSTTGAFGINRVELNTIDNNNTGIGSFPYYEDYTATHQTALETGSSHDLTLTAFNFQTTFNDFFVWIDWNGDGDFDDANEEVGCAIDVSSPHIFSFDVPLDANVSATTRMRVRVALNRTCANTSACDTTQYGEVEDYGIVLAAGNTTWTGTSSDDWSDVSNWDIGYVPSVSLSAVIPNTTTKPVIYGQADVYNLEIQNSASLTLKPTAFLTVNGDLNGEFGDMTVESDATGNGSVIVKGAVSGFTTVERYIGAWSSGGDGWHIISSPINGNIDINTSNFDPGAMDDFYGWSETENVWKNHKQGDPSQMTPTTGYLVAYQNNKTGEFVGEITSVTPTSITGLTVSAGANSGWHLRGNPFPSAITWNLPTADWRLTSVGGVAKVWNEAAANYSDIGLGGIIPSTSGFFVQSSVNGAGSFDIPASARIHSSVNNYKLKEVNGLNETLELTITNNVNSFYDVTRIGFKEDATEAWDEAFDSRKLYGRSSSPQLWTVTNDETYSWNNLPNTIDSYGIPLHFRAGVDGNYQIVAEGVMSFEMTNEIFLEDYKEEKVINLYDQNVYNFTASTEDAVNRFAIHFFGVTNLEEMEEKLIANIYAAGNSVYVHFTELPVNESQIMIYNAYGKVMYSRVLSPEKISTIQFAEKPGMYIVRLQSDQSTITQKVMIK